MARMSDIKVKVQVLKTTAAEFQAVIKKAEERIMQTCLLSASLLYPSPPKETWGSEEPSILNDFHEWWQWAKAKHKPLPLQQYIFERNIRRTLRTYRHSMYALPYVVDRRALLSNAGT